MMAKHLDLEDGVLARTELMGMYKTAEHMAVGHDVAAPQLRPILIGAGSKPGITQGLLIVRIVGAKRHAMTAWADRDGVWPEWA